MVGLPSWGEKLVGWGRELEIMAGWGPGPMLEGGILKLSRSLLPGMVHNVLF